MLKPEKVIYKYVSEHSHEFNPNTEVSDDVEQFLRVNVTVNHDRLERWIAWLVLEAYDLGLDEGRNEERADSA